MSCARTRARRSRPRRDDRRGSRSRASRRGSPTWAATSATRRRSSASRARSRAPRSPVFYLEIPPALFGMVVDGLAGAGLTERARVVVEKPFGHDLESARALQRRARASTCDEDAALPDRPLPREDGAGRDPLPAVRERDLRADLEPQLRLVRADHDGRGLRRRRPRPLLRPGRRAARRGGQPPDAGGRRGGDGAARGAGRRARSRTRSPRSCARRAPPTRRTTCAGSTRATATIDGVAPDSHDRDLRRAAAGDRQLALVRRAVLHPHRQVPPDDADRGAARLPPAASAGLPAASACSRPEPDQLVVKLDPSTGIRMVVDAKRGEGRRPERDHHGHGVRRRRAARAPTPYEVLLARRDARRRARASRARTASRSSGGSCSRCSTRRRRCIRTRRARWGPAAGTQLPHGYGGWHGPWVAS